MTASRKDSRLSENEKEVLNFLMERKSSGYSPISRKVLSGLRKTINRKVIDISELKNAKIHAENLEKSVITEKELAVLNPLHGVYAYGQNKISVFIEQIAELPALSKLTNAYADAGDIYMPSGPPMSPLTKSYFLCWGFFDLCVGIKKESFGTVIIDILFRKCEVNDLYLQVKRAGTSFLKEILGKRKLKINIVLMSFV
jgi:hypothetical protein